MKDQPTSISDRAAKVKPIKPEIADEPSAAAMRAAKDILFLKKANDSFKSLLTCNDYQIASIIDRETGVKELGAVMQKWISECVMVSKTNHLCLNHDALAKDLRDALAKAKGQP